MSFLSSAGTFPTKDAATPTNYAGGEYSTNLKFLPNPGQWPVTKKDVLDTAAEGASPSDQQLSVAAENDLLRIIYGQVLIGPQIANVLSYQGDLIILAIWGHGEIDSYVNMYVDDKPPDPSISFIHYRGTQTQTVDSLLESAFAADTLNPKMFTDSMIGVAYSVIRVPAKTTSGFPRVTALIKGRKIWNGSSNIWTDNPAYCIADFITNTEYGMARTVNWTSVVNVANICDFMVGGTEKLRTLNLCIDSAQPCATWLDTLRTYASCWVVQDSSGALKLVPDNVTSTAMTFSSDAGEISSISNIIKRGIQNTPTVMMLTYVDTTINPYRDATVTIYAPGVLTGSVPRRESTISLPGINRYTQAYREAVERLNKLYMNDLSFTLVVFDIGLSLDIGDVIEVTHPIMGTLAKKMRVMTIAGEYGRYTLGLSEYDPAVYSSDIPSAPTYADTNLPNPINPPVVTSVQMTEEVYKLESGVYSSRWKVTWTAATYPYLLNYRCELYIGSDLITASTSNISEWRTTPIQEDKVYTVKVAAVTTIGAVGAWGTNSATALGKQLVPSDVPSVTAFEAGGTIYTSWAAAIDIDIWRYEVRYGAVGVTWANTKLLDRVDALRVQSDQIPVGTWTLHVKALDSVGNYSVNAATVNVIVTSDASAFLVSTYNQTAPTLTNMAEYALARTDTNRYFVTEDGTTVASKFTAALSTYTNVMSTYHASITSTWLGESEDFGLDLGGQWTGTATVSDISGTHISYLGTAMAADPGTFVYNAGLSQKLNARFARMKHESLTTSTMKVTIPTQEIRLDSVPREEVGIGTSSSSGPLTVTLINSYVAVKKLTITPLGTTARSAVADNILFVGSVAKFDVYVFDNTGVKIASPFRYEWQGV